MRFLLVDDHPMFREALQSAVRLASPEARILEAASIEAAMETIAATPDIDVVLLDLSLPGTTGFGGLIKMRTQWPKLAIVVVSGHEEPRIVREALSLGIAGDIPKSTPKEEIAHGLGEVLAGAVFVPAHLVPVVEERDPATLETAAIIERLAELTPQQLRVLEMIRDGLQNKQIAYRLSIGETTVKAHVSEILRKLQVYSRTKAVILLSKADFDAIGGRGA